VTEKVSYDIMMADFQGPGVDARLRQLLSKASPIKWGLFHHLRTSIYFRDRVAILGDSAHASLPFQAAGAAQGVEDALVLSNVLTAILTNGANRLPDIRAALAAYDSVRRPRAQKQLEQSAEVARMMFFQHEEAGANMKRILPKLQQGRFDWLWFHEIEKDVDTAIVKMQEVKSI
jgi:salicylate hydroxylase